MNTIRSFAMMCLSILLSTTLSHTQESDAGGEPKDIPYFSRMPEYDISESNDRDFGAYQFFDGKKIVTVEGKLFSKHYALREDATKQASELQIRRNYLNAIKVMGGVIVFEGRYDEFEDTRAGATMVTGRVTKRGKDLWVEVFPCNDGNDYWLTVLEKEAMHQDVTASDMLRMLNAEGHVALYINFDLNKATIKPESQSIVDQVVSLLKENPSLKLSIEGHTDNTGDVKKNKTLSEQRAKSVLEAIVKQSIETGRLSTIGWGQERPVADNNTDDGRAKNRRVELVKK